MREGVLKVSKFSKFSFMMGRMGGKPRWQNKKLTTTLVTIKHETQLILSVVRVCRMLLDNL